MAVNLGLIASQISGHLTPTTGFVSIASATVGSGGASSISFSNIPQIYKHLQVRWYAATNDGNFNALIIRYNSDSNSNYSWHAVYGSGNGGSGTTEVNTSDTNIRSIGTAGTTQSGIFNAGICDVLDYNNTSKHKTSRIMSGISATNSGYAILSSGLWRDFGAISTISIAPITGGGLLTEYSSFGLYGIEG